MLHLYSKGCEYAILALTEISPKRGVGGFSVKSACKAAGIPESFTRKIFQSLVKSQILDGRPGPGGGYRFRKDPSQISLLDIIYAVDGKNAFEKCVIKDFKCDETNHCPLHSMWLKAKSSMMKDLKKSTVAGLSGANKSKKETKR
jgi:Rrf2 family protein